jgi:hypothetical protein
MATIGGSNIVTSGLVLSLDAANSRSYPGSGTTWRDLSGNNNSGSLVNGPTFNSANGGSIVFDGTNDNINLGNPDSLNITGSITLSSWIRLTNWNNYPGIITKGYDVTGGYSIHIRDNYSIWFEILSSTNVRQIYNPTNLIISLNSWFNVVCTYNQTQMQIYINGSAAGSGYSTSVLMKITSSNVLIGNLPTYGFFNGNISNVQIYNRALSASEIEQNYNATKARFNL